MLDFFYNFYPSRILISFFGLNIYWYGLLIFLSAIVSFIIFYSICKKNKIENNIIFDSFFYGILFGLIGARLVYVLYYFEYYFKNPLEILMFWDGGMAILGGIFFGLLGLYIYTKKNNVNFFKILNFISISLICGQIIGRFGNYFNQELFGRPTDFFLKIPISVENRPDVFINFNFFQPLFLYEIMGNFLILIILLLILRQHTKNNLETGITAKKINVRQFREKMNFLTFIEKGGIFFTYFNLYCFLRFILEFFRFNEKEFYDVTINQFVILFLLLVVNFFWFFGDRVFKKLNKNNAK